VLKLADVHVRRGARHVLRGVSVEVQPGEVVTLLGANGAGKSTTLRTISGLLRPHAGAIHYQGHDLTRLSPRAIVQLGIVQVPEGRLLFGDMTVDENLEVGAAARAHRGKLADDFERVFALFPVLRERRRQLAATLSGGQQQMVAIGRGLMARPSLFLLDEPSLGLAPQMVDLIARAIRDIAGAGTTILLVEQNASLALRLAKRAYVLEGGQTVLTGDASDLLTSSSLRDAYLGV
jgi:branched-chain amino acid transport system ATP-binding protein